jgi:hypothetical protein
MRRRGRLAVLALVAACGGAGATGHDADIGGGSVSVRWEDGDSVDISLEVPGTARWCATGRWLELSAVRGDTGVMLALFPPETLVAATYPISRPVRDDSLRVRPAATLGVRWFTPGLVAGYRGWQGEVRVTAVEPGPTGGRTISGRLEGGAAAVAGAGGAIAVEGEFDDVPVAEADSGCSPLPGG